MKTVFSVLTAVALLATTGTASAAQVFFQGKSTVDPNAQSTLIIDAVITDVGPMSFWSTFDLTVELVGVLGPLTATFSSVENVSAVPDYIFEGTSANYNAVVGSGGLTANSSDETSLAEGVPASLANSLLARFVIDISGTSIGQEFAISLCETGLGCLNTNRLEGFDDNSIFRVDDIVADAKTITLAAVPIPAAIWLFGSGLLGLIGIARRKAHA